MPTLHDSGEASMSKKFQGILKGGPFMQNSLIDLTEMASFGVQAWPREPWGPNHLPQN